VAESPRKRKRRAGAAGGDAAASRPKTPRERMEAGYAKAEVRNQAAREALTPLEDGERPPVVTVAAILAALVAISIVVTVAAGV
jgi:HEAT repeat protein